MAIGGSGRSLGRGARGLLRRHSASIERGADIGARSAGLGWMFALGIYGAIVLIAWVVALFVGGWAWVAAIALTVSILPPMVKELRKRSEIREALNLDPRVRDR